jgi:hypothetical protein
VRGFKRREVGGREEDGGELSVATERRGKVGGWWGNKRSEGAKAKGDKVRER